MACGIHRTARGLWREIGFGKDYLGMEKKGMP